jgi:hypothetical protein
MAHETDASMTTLVKGAIDDVRDLFREELALARAELRQELGKAAGAAGAFAGAAAAVGIAGVFILTAIALGIADLLNWPAWAGFAIVGILLAAAGGILFASARRTARNIRPLPRTVETVKETFQ